MLLTTPWYSGTKKTHCCSLWGRKAAGSSHTHVTPLQPQRDYLGLQQLFSWCRTEETHVGLQCSGGGIRSSCILCCCPCHPPGSDHSILPLPSFDPCPPSPPRPETLPHLLAGSLLCAASAAGREAWCQVAQANPTSAIYTAATNSRCSESADVSSTAWAQNQLAYNAIVWS